MKKPQLLIGMFLIFATVFIAGDVMSSMNDFNKTTYAGDATGPGVGTTKNCTTCHTGVPVISGNTVRNVFTFDSGQTKYVPGTVYNIKFKILGSTPVGFSSTVLRNDSNKMAGVLTPSDTTETKLYNHVASGRNYLNHRTGNPTSGEKEYSFTWTAPAAGTGAVTFYFSSLVSNNDQSTSDDTTFVNSYVISEDAPTTGVSEAVSTNTFVAYPNPVSDRIQISFLNKTTENTVVTLYNMNGQESITLLNDNLIAGMQHLSFDLSGKVKSGIYFVKVSNSSMNSIQKILVY